MLASMKFEIRFYYSKKKMRATFNSATDTAIHTHDFISKRFCFAKVLDESRNVKSLYCSALFLISEPKYIS